MPPRDLFNRYDLRGSYPGEINEDVAEKLGYGTAAYLNNNGEVVIGYDTRPHSHKVGDALADGLRESGVTVTQIGLSPTDKVALATNTWGADLGIMVTASHHAWQRTGCKYIYTQGHGFSNDDMDKVKERYNTTPTANTTSPLQNREKEANTLYKEQLHTIAEQYITPSDATVVADCCTGAATPFLPQLLHQQGYNAVPRNTNTTPNTELDPEPTRENRASMQDALKTEDADLVVGTDPDADRVYAIDKTGEWVSGQELFAILADLVDADTIAASLDTSTMLKEHTNANIAETRVGDVFVAAQAVKMDADMYGEPNGHYAFPRFCWYPSGILSALLLAGIAHELPEKRAQLPQYTTVRHTEEYRSNKEKQEHMKQIISFVEKNYDVISTVDGVKFRVEDGTVLIRPSGTSPKIRCIFEHKNQERAEWMREILVNQFTTQQLL